MTSNKQLEANKNNALKGGVKTKEGKEKVKYNAIKHGLSSNIYDIELEQNLIKEYSIKGTLEKMLVKNTCIAKSRYEKGVNLEHQLMKHIIRPAKYEKVYNSQKEYENYITEKQRSDEMFENNVFSPTEPKYTMQKIEGDIFDYNTEKIEYLVSIIGKYNYQNEVRLNKNIIDLLSLVK